METMNPPIPSKVTSERLLLLSLAVVVVVLLALAVAVAGLAASAFACFLASLARRLRSASLLLLSTRPGFFAGFVCGGSAVTRAGVGVGAGATVSSGIDSSGCEAIGYIWGSEFYKVPVSFLSASCHVLVQASHFIKAFEWITFLVSAGVRGGCCVVQIQQVGLRFSLKLDVFGRDEGGVGQGQPAPAV